ncbi:MAG: type II toxin-antitoxin system mRNA interferase toxin, RelE/StbE family [Nanoarchaeota archaeon]|nr:type II toxin-antitoxin system mRNA interferase toxin, RelE/StbE family [Nanoarchaeota archaeon]
MYEITTKGKGVEKKFRQYLNDKVIKKLELLKQDPRRNLDAHKLKGKLQDKWSCWLESNVRIIYEIDDENKEIMVIAIGSHKIYF